MKKVDDRQSLQVRLGGRLISCWVRRSARAKHVSIRVSPDSGLEVVLPGGIREYNIEACLKSREDWIIAKLDHYGRLREKRDSRRAMFLGRTYKLVPVIKHGAAPAVKMLDGDIFVTVPYNSPEALSLILEKWYRALARAIFEEKVRAISSETGHAVNRIFIRGQKTRWGSCSRLGNLSFNWRLVMAPEEVIDYIVIHELCHLKEMNHSKRFWSLVSNLCPDYKKHRRWLKENGCALNL
jgi:predicted metal-dependent hydrolase